MLRRTAENENGILGTVEGKNSMLRRTDCENSMLRSAVERENGMI